MLERGRAFLERHGRGSARLESELLCAHALSLSRLELFLVLERPVEPEELARARELLVRRARGEPCGYLTGEREFYGRPFRVGPGVLVPRPETELLVDIARERLGGRPRVQRRVLEFGTGSGCIAITLALEVEGCRVVANEASPLALEFARTNAARLGAEVEWLDEGGVEPLTRAFGQEAGADLFCANPPYVVPDDPALDPAVRAHEPPQALLAPAGDPDHWVGAFVDAAPRLVRPGGTLLVELGIGQAERLRQRWGERARFHRDLGGVERVLEWTRSPGD